MSIILFTIIAILFVADASCQDPIRKFGSYSIFDRVSIILNVILAIAYLSVYVISNLMFMANGKPYDNKFDGLEVILHFAEFIIPLICIISIALSVKWRKIGKSIGAFWIQFFPIFIFPVKYFLK
ncbi:hypothetical protein [Clostridium sp. C2-6-12]|uniref:hypothetical protein n=1 Tax=Clostridium sp. C2-6-12 TaxID=2698832 RepID=UPI00136C1FA7|nr:hypothetical protein [Clostridium sp. C2-6-12]